MTSAVYSPRLKKNIAMAMVDLQFCELGADVEVEMIDGVCNAIMVVMPFYDPKKNIAKI